MYALREIRRFKTVKETKKEISLNVKKQKRWKKKEKTVWKSVE